MFFVIGIVAGVAALLAIVIAILSITGNLDFIKPNKGATSSGIASSVEDEKGNKEFTLEVDSAKKESIITVPIIVSNNTGFYAGEFLLTFDSSVLSYVDYSEGTIVDQYELEPSDGKVKILAYNSAYEDVKGDGTVMELNFKVLKKADDGNYKITLQKDGTMLGSFATGEEVKADIALGNPKVK